jgi:cytidyltransferase-like protein
MIKIYKLLLILGVISGLSGYFIYQHKKASKNSIQPVVGIYWGAFDPPTDAHIAIISTALKALPVTKLVVVVNNHAYKKYDYPLESRLQMIRQKLSPEDLNKLEILWQNDSYKLDYPALKQKYPETSFYAIAGYDAYKKWLEYSKSHDRSMYEAIIVVPRGEETPELCDDNALLMPIDDIYRHVSSTQIKKNAGSF